MNQRKDNFKQNKTVSKNRFNAWNRCLLALLLITNLLDVKVLALAGHKIDDNKNLNKSVSKSNTSVSPSLQFPSDVLITRHSPNLNGNRVEGAIRVLEGESFSINSNTVVTGNIYVAGTPNININAGGNSTYRGTIAGTGSSNPTGYSINLNSNTTLNHIITKTDPIVINNLGNVAPPQGNRDVTLTKNQSPGDFSTIRNLTLNSSYGLLAVPPGSYGQITSNSNSGFILGVDNQSTTYNLQGLNLNSSTEIQVKGSVTLNIQNTVNLSSNVKVGNASSPVSLSLNISNGGVTLNSNTEVYGAIKAPLGTVNLNSNSKLTGLLICDRANLNANSLLKGFVQDSLSPQVSISSPTPNQTINTATIIVTGSFSDDSVVTQVKVNNVTANITASNYTATIPIANGNNTITVTATDIFGNSGLSTVDIIRTDGINQTPSVNAGLDQSITLPTNKVNLAATVTDDGLPNPPGQVTVTWSKVSSPSGATVTFSNANALTTTATFSAAGNYVLKLEASDSQLSASDTVTITVNQQPPQNQAPVVSAGQDQTITLPSVANLTATVTDDGLPNPPSQLTLSWSKVSGSGTVSFSSANTATTSATFSQAGVYVLRLSATDSILTGTDDLTITVNPVQVNNQAPQVNAGQDQTINLPNSVTLQGQVSDDGNPNPPSQLTLTWSRVEGPGAVTFTNANGAITQASFLVAGTYTLRLTASDSALSSSDDVIVIVNAGANQAPVVSAGADIDVLLPEVIALSATASDDGFPVGSNLSFTWSKVEGPSNVSFSDPNSLTTFVVFELAGVYRLKFSATDGQLSSSDEMVVNLRVRKHLPLYSNGYGFESDELRVKAGEKTIIIRNRSGLELTYVFTQGSQTLSMLAKAGEDIFMDATLEVGTATITVSGRPEWTCTITVVP
ncbi:MAG: hypothetical protein HY819_11310 [Acidobacteria bacterium]|nr:hypothetical protein [Acidobacteriota bacterium]